MKKNLKIIFIFLLFFVQAGTKNESYALAPISNIAKTFEKANILEESNIKSNYINLLDNLNKGYNPAPYNGRQFTSPFRYSLLHRILLNISNEALENSLNTLVLGAGANLFRDKEDVIPDPDEDEDSFYNPNLWYSPQIVEILSILRKKIDYLTVVDASDHVLNVIENIKKNNSNQRIYKLPENHNKEVLKEKLDDDFNEIIARLIDIFDLNKNENLEGTHFIKEGVINPEKINTFLGYFQDISYGKRELDLIVSTYALKYALNPKDQKACFDLMAKVINSLKTNGKLIIDIKAFATLGDPGSWKKDNFWNVPKVSSSQEIKKHISILRERIDYLEACFKTYYGINIKIEIVPDHYELNDSLVIFTRDKTEDRVPKDEQLFEVSA